MDCIIAQLVPLQVLGNMSSKGCGLWIGLQKMRN